jgi:hypothetical protein
LRAGGSLGALRTGRAFRCRHGAGGGVRGAVGVVGGLLFLLLFLIYIVLLVFALVVAVAVLPFAAIGLLGVDTNVVESEGRQQRQPGGAERAKDVTPGPGAFQDLWRRRLIALRCVLAHCSQNTPCAPARVPLRPSPRFVP